jgi:hypothetical protein
LNVRARHALLVLLLLGLAADRAGAQWRPSGELATVPVVRDCLETGGDVAVSRLEPPTIYLCPSVMALVRARNAGAEHFYLVHEYGHIALATSDESAADCWAARELALAPNGARYLRAAIAHFRERGDVPSARYGSPRERAERVRRCADAALAPP